MNVPKRSHAEIEALASKLTPEGKGLFDGRSLRVEALVSYVGLTLMPVRGLAEIAEAYIPFKRGFIFIDEDQYLDGQSYRYRFTICEEIAHDALHRPLFDGMSVEQVQKAQGELTTKEYLQIEWEAKHLAACLLMRPAWFKERYMHLYAVQRDRCANPIATLKYVVRQLSGHFNVSCHSVAIHARSLGFLDQVELDELLANWDI